VALLEVPMSLDAKGRSFGDAKSRRELTTLREDRFIDLRWRFTPFVIPWLVAVAMLIQGRCCLVSPASFSSRTRTDWRFPPGGRP
jgi:hypothetical protein